MTVRRYLQLDVFANRPGAGNPLGVVFDASDMEADAMQAYAAWANLSETLFFLPPTSPDADYRVRIFTPRQELPFAGHPSVGAAWAALDSGLAQAKDGRLVQECAAGLLPIRIEQRDTTRLIHIRAPQAREVETGSLHAEAVASALQGLPRGKLAPALWNNGPNWWLVELADAAAVRAMRPDLPAIATLSAASDAVGLVVFGRAEGSDHDLAVRAYCPADGIPEDPVTGSANASIAALLHHAGALPGAEGRYIASQGRELGRDGRVEVQVDYENEVWIGGRVQAVIRGSVDW
ncbi:PhzF family phenazine biosynthesis protein [Pseudoxanthomonas sacheonensis]|uniref:PhzF family phenazine biosynthesis protein n=1 Tax=Pseudoxanthomonas sacheonensis TaxID=443615 RepID=A0ABU1RMK3_9GAMM|nr:PhzF family phenazine biosynthesis protein [Pseudoxanthomonas sacheonensis]MDR6840008.1 PhzF family phenazine biosynthesis protein [Pseudoxanthomonas sacheonensis]